MSADDEAHDGADDIGDELDALGALAADLRALMATSGLRSYRAIARAAHYSHTVVAAAAAGRTFPSLEVTLAFVRACGGDEDAWRARWDAVRAERSVLGYDPLQAEPPWPAQPAVDGADPEQAGCAADAVTVHACKVAAEGSRHLLGQLELRWSRRRHAAWGRFRGFPGLDHLARERAVEIVVGVTRASDGVRQPFRIGYAFDWHFGDILLTRGTALHAWVEVVVDGVVHAVGETEPRVLP